MFITVSAFLGLLINLTYGLWAGLIFSIFIIALFAKWGEKLVLVFAKARYVTDDEALINQVKNFCCHLGIEEVKVYWSNTFVNNVYYSDAYFGKPALIIGKNIYKQFTRNELNSLIYASLLKIKSNEAKNRTQISLIFYILYSPVYLLRALLGSSRIRRSLDVFFYPAFILKMLMYENEKQVLAFDQLVGKMEGLKKDYIASLFKISTMPGFGEKTTGALLLAELSHSKNATEDVINDLLYKEVDINMRIKALSTKQ